MKTIEEVMEKHEIQNLEEVLAEYNDYLQNKLYDYEDYIYNMAEFDDFMNGATPTEIIEQIDYPNFNTSDKYFIATIWGIKSGDDLTELIDKDLLDEILDEKKKTA